MRAINVLAITGYAFLGIVELPASLETRGRELYQLINNSEDQISHSLHDFLGTLDRYDADTMKTYAALACQNMWLFFQLQDSSLSLVIVSERCMTLFWPDVLDWQYGSGLLLCGIALTLAALEAKQIFRHSHLMEIYQVSTPGPTSTTRAGRQLDTSVSQNTPETEFSLAHFQAWAVAPYGVIETGVKKLVRSRFGHKCGYICVQKNRSRTLEAFLRVDRAEQSGVGQQFVHPLIGKHLRICDKKSCKSSPI